VGSIILRKCEGGRITPHNGMCNIDGGGRVGGDDYNDAR